MFTQPQGTCIILIKFLPHYHIHMYFCIQSQTTSSISSSVSSAGPSMQESSSLYSYSWSFIRVKTPLQRVDDEASIAFAREKSSSSAKRNSPLFSPFPESKSSTESSLPATIFKITALDS